METKFCPKCGSELPADAKFCIYCGTPQPTEAAPVPETVIQPETEIKAPVPETVIQPETEIKATVPETVSLSETEEKAPVPETVSPPKPEVKAPVPDNRYMDYSYEPQSYEVENGNSQGAGALVVFLLVLSMIVVSLVVCMVMATASFVNKNIKNKDKDFSVSYEYDGYDDDDEGGGYVDEDDEYGYDGADGDRGYEDRRENFLNSLYPWLDSTQEPMDGYFKSGDYKVGEDIPAGTYFVKANIFKMESGTESVAYRSISTDADGEDVLISGWFNYSTYVELKEGTYFHMSHCGAFDVSKCPIENDPFEHHGTFMVGTDVEPGTYEIVLVDGGDHADYAVYEKAEDIGVPFWISDSRALYGGGAYGGEKVTLEEGQFLELTDAVLSYGDDTGDAADTADDDGEVFYGSD